MLEISSSSRARERLLVAIAIIFLLSAIGLALKSASKSLEKSLESVRIEIDNVTPQYNPPMFIGTLRIINDGDKEIVIENATIHLEFWSFPHGEFIEFGIYEPEGRRLEIPPNDYLQLSGIQFRVRRMGVAPLSAVVKSAYVALDRYGFKPMRIRITGVVRGFLVKRNVNIQGTKIIRYRKRAS